MMFRPVTLYSGLLVMHGRPRNWANVVVHLCTGMIESFLAKHRSSITNTSQTLRMALVADRHGSWCALRMLASSACLASASAIS